MLLIDGAPYYLLEIMKKILLYLLFSIFLFSCGAKDQDIVADVDLVPVSGEEHNKASQEGAARPNTRVEVGVRKDISHSEQDYIPRTKNPHDDEDYMTDVYHLIDSVARSQGVKAKNRFARIALAVAWTESKWEHYSVRSGRVRIFMGDNGNSYGIFQIHKRWHGRKPKLIENVKYAINLLVPIYHMALGKPCSRGTNAGNTLDAVLRRVYAAYNAGTDDICRDRDSRDEKFRNYYYKQPWKDHINL